MKLILVSLVLFAALSAPAQNQEIACWNIYSPKGSAPILKAQVGPGATLRLLFNLGDSYFQTYFFDDKTCSVGGCSHDVGSLSQVKEVVAARPIVSSRSSYIGNNEYVFVLGQEVYDFVSPSYPAQNRHQITTVDARLILPTNLSNAFLKDFHIRNPNERSNAVVVLDPSAKTSQGGDNYLRLYCVSNF